MKKMRSRFDEASEGVKDSLSIVFDKSEQNGFTGNERILIEDLARRSAHQVWFTGI